MHHAPLEFHQIGLNPNDFFYSDSKSWRGPCPMCGGSRRFVMFTDHPWPLFNGFCDECGMTIKAWEKVRAQVDPIKAAQAQAAREAEDRARAEYRRHKMAEFTTGEVWQEPHERMTLEHVDWWESQGVPQEVQNELRIGYQSNHSYYPFGLDKAERIPANLVHSPAYTIPWFGQGLIFQTMQYRLLNPANPKDRYRFEDGLGGGQYYYMTEPNKPIGDKVIICEGAKKAIVTWFWLAPMLEFTVLAASSANTFGAALEATKDCGLRYVIMDPGAEVWAKRAVATKPKTTHAIRLPFKIDDGWMKYGLDRDTFARVMETAL